MSTEQPEQRFDVELAPEVEAGVYADFVSIWHTPETFVLDFASLRRPPYVLEDSETGQPTAVLATRIVTRVRVPPGQVFEIMKALEQQLSAWERESGRSASGADPDLPDGE